MSVILLHHGHGVATERYASMQTRACWIILFRQVTPHCMTNLMNIGSTDMVH